MFHRVYGFIDMQEVSSPEQNDLTKQADNGIDIHYYPIPAGKKNTESINIYRQAVTMYHANEMSVQQMRKWYHNFANGWVNIMDKDPSNNLSMSKMFISYFNICAMHVY
jgi:hypothetical protein